MPGWPSQGCWAEGGPQRHPWGPVLQPLPQLWRAGVHWVSWGAGPRGGAPVYLGEHRGVQACPRGVRGGRPRQPRGPACQVVGLPHEGEGAHPWEGPRGGHGAWGLGSLGVPRGGQQGAEVLPVGAVLLPVAVLLVGVLYGPLVGVAVVDALWVGTCVLFFLHVGVYHTPSVHITHPTVPPGGGGGIAGPLAGVAPRGAAAPAARCGGGRPDGACPGGRGGGACRAAGGGVGGALVPVWVWVGDEDVLCCTCTNVFA